MKPAKPAEPIKDPARRSVGRERILEAAGRLFAVHGFPSVSAAEIAREAGVAHGLLFHHFGSMEELYAQVSRSAADQMDSAQLAAFHGATAREQIESFLRSHMASMKQRQGDAIVRWRSGAGQGGQLVAEIWEASRLRAIEKVIEVLGVARPGKKVKLCLRAWLGFHDQLVLGWLEGRTLTESEVVAWTISQLEHIARTVLSVDLDTRVPQKRPPDKRSAGAIPAADRRT